MAVEMSKKTELFSHFQTLNLNYREPQKQLFIIIDKFHHDYVKKKKLNKDSFNLVDQKCLFSLSNALSK